MGKLRDKFKQLRQKNQKAFIPYATFGFPTLELSKDILFTLQAAGADIIEIGMPFSDPIADGPTIQAASRIALNQGANLELLFDFLENYKKYFTIPLIIMSYYNPIYAWGIKRFFQRAKKVGLGGIIVPDLLPEEGKEFIDMARRTDVDTVFFISPNTEERRFKIIDNASSGFIYYVSVYGVTGMRRSFDKDVLLRGSFIKSRIKNPLCIGFGISKSSQVKKFKQIFDGVIVGSALINEINRIYHHKNFKDKLASFVRCLNK